MNSSEMRGAEGALARQPEQLDLIERSAAAPAPKRRKEPSVLKALRQESGTGLALLR